MREDCESEITKDIVHCTSLQMKHHERNMRINKVSHQFNLSSEESLTHLMVTSAEVTDEYISMTKRGQKEGRGTEGISGKNEKQADRRGRDGYSIKPDRRYAFKSQESHTIGNTYVYSTMITSKILLKEMIAVITVYETYVKFRLHQLSLGPSPTTAMHMRNEDQKSVIFIFTFIRGTNSIIGVQLCCLPSVKLSTASYKYLLGESCYETRDSNL
jgi:hypothetical protein